MDTEIIPTAAITKHLKKVGERHKATDIIPGKEDQDMEWLQNCKWKNNGCESFIGWSVSFLA